ncbi:DUF3347 domain-containing protein [Pedobacter sp. SYP-B3415]|uniref:DUF3347 domain-containing protein n=1 Tax=Pedobacter sp. SYP-B3415 TaxID=2496641 RepID=UPI0013ECBA87|nr:DUF3347 domain-containing protein [Pedobacter sp. SYP-B3415]
MKTIKVYIVLLVFLPFFSKANAPGLQDQVLAAYFEVKNALAHDNAQSAAAKAAGLAKITEAPDMRAFSEQQRARWNKHAKVINSGAKAIANTKDLKKQRQLFGELSKAMIDVAKAGGNSRDIYLQHCPMAKNSWLNEKPAVENPYYGSEMFACGSITEILAAGQ